MNWQAATGPNSTKTLMQGETLILAILTLGPNNVGNRTLLSRRARHCPQLVILEPRDWIMSASGTGPAAEAASYTKRWWQTKRVPLYIVVGGTLIGAAAHIWTWGKHPQTQTEVTRYRDDPTVDNSKIDAVERGVIKFHETARRKSDEYGMRDGQATDGVFPNAKMAHKLGDIHGPSEPEINSKEDLEKARGHKH
ncbi:hypothetical protein WJX72_011410 [[Myrmecia] bisecta]|uniref:Uncharacterized protein n=1 Tax=[Myrmecia] bisecta TaxID=41462 RepID=A0AAW1R9X1_9CHLO